MNYFAVGFYFGLGFAIANTVLAVIDKVLAMLLLKYRVRQVMKSKTKPKPPEGLNFGKKDI